MNSGINFPLLTLVFHTDPSVGGGEDDEANNERKRRKISKSTFLFLSIYLEQLLLNQVKIECLLNGDGKSIIHTHILRFILLAYIIEYHLLQLNKLLLKRNSNYIAAVRETVG